jgi:hypothetical protein
MLLHMRLAHWSSLEQVIILLSCGVRRLLLAKVQEIDVV